MDPTFFATPADFRAWLAKHHASQTELAVGFYKVGSGKPSISWPQSVDQARQAASSAHPQSRTEKIHDA